ncbi:MAG: glycyl-radical enzyme activating protein [Solobacterium sp.]|nr:glycyl-radical enzyme activating protein [Solobacterium sp.]
MKADRNKSGVIFNIQKFSVNDGPGIRTVVFFKGCPLRCRWCSNPESQLAKIQILQDPGKCLHCHHCIEICPAQAVCEASTVIHIDPFRCTACGRCAAECPGKALRLEGQQKTVQEVLDVVLQDMVFYEESGGGITLSGGEMLSQPDFAEALLIASREEGLSTCAETTGYAPESVFRKIAEYLDIILFDLKHWDPAKHKQYTGAANDLPVSNMKYARSQGKEVLPRIPVIPGFNDSPEDAEQFSALLKEIGIRKCQLLPFHQFGENKYTLLGRDYAYQNVSALHREDLEDYRQVFLDNEIQAFF